MSPVIDAIFHSKLAFEKNASSHWIVGFSGGKDSSAMLKVLLAGYKKASCKPKNVSIIYCDTGVENPVLDKYVKNLFLDLELGFREDNLNFKTHILKARLEDRFFVKVIGRGYPTPTNIFRWCTDKLRVKPVNDFIARNSSDNSIVCLGLRKSESAQRDRTLLKYENAAWQTKKTKSHCYQIYLPILELSVSDVWDIIHMRGAPSALNPDTLDNLYRGVSGECPILRPPKAPPCGSGRFGCWTCTVVRKDKSLSSLIDGGHENLRPYLEFRNWISIFRDDPNQRWKHRRNGANGPGPFTIEARKEILRRLLNLSRETGDQLISDNELVEIYRLWELDRNKEHL